MRWRVWLGVAAILSATAVGVGYTHNVPNRVAPKDAEVARAILEQSRIPRPQNYEDQVRLIAHVQRSILHAAPIDVGIPRGRSRELSDLVKARYGFCYDRSRAIETVLRVAGFETRHAFIYSREKHASPFALLTKRTRSLGTHAVSEVRTNRGWILVDSNVPWLGLTKDGTPVGLEQLQRMDQDLLLSEPTAIFRGSFGWVYGLHSRHGGFYPPYNPVPDVNWAELAQNI